MALAGSTITVFGLVVLGLQLDFVSTAAISTAVVGAWGIVFSAVSIHRSEAHRAAEDRAHERA